MHSIPLAEAKDHLDQCIDRALAGEQIAIEMNGKLVALQPVSESPPGNRAVSLAALERLHAASKLTAAEANAWCEEIRRERDAYRDE